LLQLLPAIQEELGNRGIAVPRPDFDGTDPPADNEVNDDSDHIAEKKANIEATSDEDED
jgi:hypothetical protein